MELLPFAGDFLVDGVDVFNEEELRRFIAFFAIASISFGRPSTVFNKSSKSFYSSVFDLEEFVYDCDLSLVGGSILSGYTIGWYIT